MRRLAIAGLLLCTLATPCLADPSVDAVLESAPKLFFPIRRLPSGPGGILPYIKPLSSDKGSESASFPIPRVNFVRPDLAVPLLGPVIPRDTLPPRLPSLDTPITLDLHNS